MSKSKRQIKTKTIVRLQKKSWHPIIAPALFNKQVLGQSLVGEASQLLNKAVLANAMGLTGDMKRQHVTIKFKVTSIREGQGLTSIESYEVNPAYIKRMVRRNKSKLDLSFLAMTKDNVKLRVKPVLLTKNMATGSACAGIRKKTQEFLVRQFKTMVFEDIIRDLLMNKLQNAVRGEVKKVYPVKTVEMKMLSIEEEAKDATPSLNQEPIVEVPKAEEPKAEKPKKKAKKAEPKEEKAEAKEEAPAEE